MDEKLTGDDCVEVQLDADGEYLCECCVESVVGEVQGVEEHIKNVQRGGRTITLVMDAKYTKKKSHKLRCYEYSIDTTAVHR